MENQDFKDYWENIEERTLVDINITKNIIKNDDYINWLEKFTTKNKIFNSDDWLYCPNKISEQNLNNVDKLKNFFEVIENYANDNYILPTPTEFGIVFEIKHNNVGYKIGMMSGQGICYYVVRIEKNIDDFIDYNLIKEANLTNRALMIKNKLGILEKFINNLVDEDVPVEAIVETTNKTLKLREKKQHK